MGVVGLAGKVTVDVILGILVGVTVVGENDGGRDGENVGLAVGGK